MLGGACSPSCWCARRSAGYVYRLFLVCVLLCVYRSLLGGLCCVLGGACSPSCWCACRAAGYLYRLFVVYVCWCVCIGHC